MERKISMLKFFQRSVGITKFFGLTVFQYPSKCFKISWTGLTIAILNILLNMTKFFGIFYFAGKNPYPENLPKNLRLINTLITFSFGASVFCSTMILLINLFSSKKIFDTLKKVENLENEVNKFIFYKC